MPNRLKITPWPNELGFIFTLGRLLPEQKPPANERSTMDYLWYWARYTYERGYEHFGPYPTRKDAEKAIDEEKQKQPPVKGLCSYSPAYYMPKLEGE